MSNPFHKRIFTVLVQFSDNHAAVSFDIITLHAVQAMVTAARKIDADEIDLVSTIRIMEVKEIIQHA
jgi:hypothetical protein